MAPKSTVRRPRVRVCLWAGVLTSAVALGITGGEFHTTTASTPMHPVARVAASTLLRSVAVARSVGYPSAAPDQLPTPVATAAPAPPQATAAPAAPVNTSIAIAAPAARIVAAPVHRLAPPARPAPAAPPARPAPPPPAPRPAAYRNHLSSGDGSLNTGVGYYGDCSGGSALTRVSAAIDGCIGGRLYFVGHNPGVFTPLMHMGVGSVITYWDNNGTAHAMRVVGVRQWYRSNGVPNLINGASVEFQTCITSDGSLDRILDAVYI